VEFEISFFSFCGWIVHTARTVWCINYIKKLEFPQMKLTAWHISPPSFSGKVLWVLFFSWQKRERGKKKGDPCREMLEQSRCVITGKNTYSPLMFFYMLPLMWGAL
jgi:hypothetical protein